MAEMGMQGSKAEMGAPAIQGPPKGANRSTPTCRGPLDSPVECSLETTGMVRFRLTVDTLGMPFRLFVVQGDSLLLGLPVPSWEKRETVVRSSGGPAPDARPSAQRAEYDRITAGKTAETTR
jgi:hypothetical protein